MDKVVELDGLLPEDLTLEGKRIVIDLNNIPDPPRRLVRRVPIKDARHLQTKASSPDEFFEEYGFVLLNAPTAVSDWDSELGSVYFPEVQQMVTQQLLPGPDVR